MGHLMIKRKLTLKAVGRMGVMFKMWSAGGMYLALMQGMPTGAYIEYVIRPWFEGQVKARNDGSGSRRNCASL